MRTPSADTRRSFYRHCRECGKLAKTSPYFCRNCTRNLDRQAKRYRENKLKTKEDMMAIAYIADVERRLAENPKYLVSLTGQRRSGMATMACRVGEIMKDPKYAETFIKIHLEGKDE